MSREKHYDAPKWETVGKQREPSRLGGTVIGSVVVGALLIHGFTDADKKDEPHIPRDKITAPAQQNQFEQSVDLIASKYDSCSIAAIHDIHIQPSENQIPYEGEDRKRTTLNTVVRVDRNENAALALEKFDSNADIQWHAPILQAQVSVNDGEPIGQVTGPGLENEYTLPDSNIQRDNVNVHEPVSSFDVKLYPLINYETDNTAISFSIRTNANIKGDSRTEKNVIRQCSGKALFDRATKSWSLIE